MEEKSDNNIVEVNDIELVNPEILNQEETNNPTQEKYKRVYSKVKIDRFLNTLIKGGGSFLVRFGSECNELIFDETHYIFATKNKNFPAKFICLFNMVKRDAEKFVNENHFIDFPPKVNVTEYNYNYDDSYGNITATDLDHAFWRIAYVKGYISKKTYEKGLDKKAKAIRLASLSILGRKKEFEKYENGVKTNVVVKSEMNEQLRNIYYDIRHSCYYMMYELSTMLKQDFDCWKTDCIYYRDTDKNRLLVQNYFKERNILYKQLIY